MSILRKPHGFGLLVQFNRNCPTGSTVVVPVVVKAVAVVVVAVAAVACCCSFVGKDCSIL